MFKSIVEQIAALGTELNANQYRIVRLVARYEASLEWFDQGFASPAMAIARTLGVHTSTAREWIRVGHALDVLPLIDDAFASNRLSYAKARILTRWADPENEQELLDLASDRTANRLTTAVSKYLAGEETDAERDQRHHDSRSVTVHTDAEGMIIIRAALPPNIGKAVAEALNSIVQRIAATSADEPSGQSDSEAFGAGGLPEVFGDLPQPQPQPVLPTTLSQQKASPDAPHRPKARSQKISRPTIEHQLRQLRQQWQQADDDEFWIPSIAQQRADAFAVLFLGTNINLTTEVVIHVRGDGATFDDGTPITNSSVCRRLDQSFIRLMIQDAERRPINASNRRRHPTKRQKRVVLEAHNHECVDCQGTELLELDHNPPYDQSRHTITTELEPRCAPCHRTRHRNTPNRSERRDLATVG